MPQVYHVTVASAVYAKLAEQQDYLSWRAGEAIATQYIDGILGYLAGLETFPRRGHRRDDLLPGLMVIGYGKSANIAVVIEGAHCYVVGLFFGGEDYEESLLDLDLSDIEGS